MKNNNPGLNASAVGIAGVTRADAPVSVRPVRRIVTGHDAQGRSVFLSDGPTPNSFKSEYSPVVAQVAWAVDQVPVRFRPHEEPAPQGKQFKIGPERGGVILRFVDFAPDTEYDTAQMSKFLEQVGGHEARADGNARHFWFHKTATLDYGIVLEGEIWAMMDVGETLMTAGDVIIQRATNHSWSNRSSKPCRMVFVLIDAMGDASAAAG